MELNFRSLSAFPEPHRVSDVLSVRLIAALICVGVHIHMILTHIPLE